MKHMDLPELMYHRDYQPFLQELLAYQKAGVLLTVGGRITNAKEITDLIMIRDRGSYMEDFIRDGSGTLVELRFDRLSDKLLS